MKEKYSLTRVICVALTRNCSFRHDFIENVVVLGSMFFRCLNHFTLETASSASAIGDLTNPFQTVFDHSILMLPKHERPKPFNFLKQCHLLSSHSAFLKELQPDRLGLPNRTSPVQDRVSRHLPRIGPNSSAGITSHDRFLRQFGRPAPLPYTGWLPDDVNREFFAKLPIRFQSTLLQHFLPTIPSVITPGMARELIHWPSWVDQWVHHSSSLLLLPEHYDVLIPCLMRLNESVSEDVEIDDLILEQFCDETLVECLISVKPFVGVLTLIDQLASKSPTFFSLLGAVCNRLTNNPSKEVVRSMLVVLGVMAQHEGFENNFIDVCMTAVLRAVCNHENRCSRLSLLKAASVFLQSGPELPIRLVPFIGFMFLTGCRILIKPALDLSLKLPEQNKDDIIPYIQSAFDRIVIQIHTGREIPELSLFLKTFPIVATARRPEMLNLLSKLLRESPDNSVELIGLLFSLFVPKRNQSQSVLLSDSLSFDANKPTIELPIPNSIIQQAPDFWDLFTVFRPLINQMVQRSPRLISTTFHFLQNYPELLDFNLRVTIFQESIRKNLINRPLQITVHRSDILEDSYLNFQRIRIPDLLGQIRVRFIGEDGVDAGGLTKNWFTTLVKALFNPNYALFTPSANGRSFQPSPTSHTVSDHLSWFKFSGKIIARALMERIPVEAHLTTSFCKQLLQLPVTLRDLEAVNREVHDSLLWIRKNDVTDLDLNFEADVQLGLGVCMTEDLKPGGREIKLTNENKEEYVGLMVELRLKRQIRDQVKAFCEGFYELIPVEELRTFSPSELDLLICGVPEIDVNDFEENCEFNPPYSQRHRVVRLFFDTIRNWENERLAKLILFITGSSQIPMNGFRMLRDMGQPIMISPGGDAGRLPAAHTCANTLDLPAYETEEELNAKLSFAIQECNSFEFK